MIPVLTLAMAGTLFAQDAPAAPQKKITSAFQMFFWVDDDLFGLLAVWLLILMSVITVALVIQHMMLNKAETFLSRETLPEYESMLGEKRFREAIERAAGDTTLFGKMVHGSLSEAPNGYGAMERALEEVADFESARRSRNLELLNVLGATGPMIGLFGTVYGMIAAFYTIVDKGGQPNPADLASGIATALVTTFWGLVVGIPAVAAVALIRARIDANTVECMMQAETLIGQFAPGKKLTASSSSAGSSAAATAGSSSTPKPRPA
jgi:biopolymer transport protein ExbB